MAVLGGIVPRVLGVDEIGRMPLSDIRASIRSDNPHLPTSRLILLENTAGGRFGAAIPLDYFAAVREIADEHGLHVHLDGARLFNAATKLGVPASDIAQYVDSVTFCLSKGLCAPVGSVVCGSAEFIHAAHRARKLVGGGMRQAGILAAAGIVAIEEMTLRLHEDHANAAHLAAGLAQIDALHVEPVHTNMVFFSLTDNVQLSAAEVATQLKERHNVWIGARSARAFRAVTHYWVDREAVNLLLAGLREILSEPSPMSSEQSVEYYG
jgi:threonine aldolase